MADSYLYFGHAQDTCNKDKEPILRIVPPGNLYITVSVFGRINTTQPRLLFEAFTNKANEDVWRNPNQVKLARILKDITDTTTIHIHKPGDTYVDSQYWPLNDNRLTADNKWTQKSTEAKYYYLFQSGLYRLTDVLEKNTPAIPVIRRE